MCRLLGYCARRPTSLAGLIGTRGLREFTALSSFHSDGWGMAWAGGRPGGPISVHKSPRQASEDPGYGELAQRPLGRLGMVHLRHATPGLPIELANTHPFLADGVALAHNGAIHPQDRLPELLPAGWEERMTGTTDSERFFLHVLSCVQAGADMVTAIGETATAITARFDASSLNAVLLTETALYAVSYHDRSKIPEARMRARGFTGSAVELAEHFDLKYRPTAGAVVVASSGWTQDPRDGWAAVPNGHVLVVEGDTLRTRIEPLPVPASPRQAS